MSEALAALALVSGDELAGSPALLVEDGAAPVAQGAARVVLALALVLLHLGIILMPCFRQGDHRHTQESIFYQFLEGESETRKNVHFDF